LGAVLCLIAFLSVNVGHASHLISLQPVSQSGAASVSTLGSSLCLACVAMQSSAVAPLFRVAVLLNVVSNSAPSLKQSPLLATKFFQLFVRPPPAV